MSFFSVLKYNSVQLQSRSKIWLDHGRGLNMAVGIKRQDFSFRKARGGGGDKGRQKEERVIEYGLCCNKGYDDLIRIYLHQHSPPVAQRGSDREDLYQ